MDAAKELERRVVGRNVIRFTYIFVVMILLAAFSIVALNIGIIKVPFTDLVTNLFRTDQGPVAIIRDLRGPRIVLSVLVGFNLAVSGLLMQAVLGNPLADPGITGVSAGASVFAITILVYYPHMSAYLPLFSFLGGLLAYTIIILLAWKHGFSPLRLVLTGVAVNAFLGGINSVLAILNTDKIQGVLLWTNGNIALRGWKHVRVLLPYTIAGIILALSVSKSADLLLLGEKNAKSIGVNVDFHRFILSLLAVYLAGISVSVVGIIGFVGLIVPHISRLLVGSNHKFLIPMSGLTGALLLLLADTLARTVVKPLELPVGIVMATVGGPFFLFLLRKRVNR